jgi:hypothetical protein
MTAMLKAEGLEVNRNRCANAVITYGSGLSFALRRMSTMTCAAARPEPDPRSKR